MDEAFQKETVSHLIRDMRSENCALYQQMALHHHAQSSQNENGMCLPMQN